MSHQIHAVRSTPIAYFDALQTIMSRCRVCIHMYSGQNVITSVAQDASKVALPEKTRLWILPAGPRLSKMLVYYGKTTIPRHALGRPRSDFRNPFSVFCERLGAPLALSSVLVGVQIENESIPKSIKMLKLFRDRFLKLPDEYCNPTFPI